FGDQPKAYVPGKGVDRGGLPGFGEPGGRVRGAARTAEQDGIREQHELPVPAHRAGRGEADSVQLGAICLAAEYTEEGLQAVPAAEAERGRFGALAGRHLVEDIGGAVEIFLEQRAERL